MTFTDPSGGQHSATLQESGSQVTYSLIIQAVSDWHQGRFRVTLSIEDIHDSADPPQSGEASNQPLYPGQTEYELEELSVWCKYIILKDAVKTTWLIICHMWWWWYHSLTAHQHQRVIQCQNR